MVLANEKRSEFCFASTPQRQKAEERTCPGGRITARELLGNAFGDAENISRVFVVIAHERFARALSLFFSITQTARDFFLRIEVQRVGGAFRQVIQVGSQSQQKIVRALDSALIGLAEPVAPDKVRRRQ